MLELMDKIKALDTRIEVIAKTSEIAHRIRSIPGFGVDAAKRFGCDLHAYVLMTNHGHLLLTPRETESGSRTL